MSLEHFPRIAGPPTASVMQLGNDTVTTANKGSDQGKVGLLKWPAQRTPSSPPNRYRGRSRESRAKHRETKAERPRLSTCYV